MYNNDIAKIGTIKTFTRTQTATNNWVFGANAEGLDSSGTYLITITAWADNFDTNKCVYIGKSYNSGEYTVGWTYSFIISGVTKQNTNAFINGTIHFITTAIRLK